MRETLGNPSVETSPPFSRALLEPTWKVPDLLPVPFLSVPD